MYKITIDASRRLLTTEFAGFLSLDEMNNYADEHKRTAALAFGAFNYSMMFDVSQCAIQSRDVVDAFQGWGKTTRTTGRIAVVTGSSIAKMQTRRSTDPTRTGVFDTRREAEAWLLSDRNRTAA